jgi:hypothetical protein
MPLVKEEWISVNEADWDHDTDLDISNGQRVILSADGSIWAGVWFTGRNGPQGWNNLADDPKFPMPNAHPYALLAKLDDEYFEVGRGVERTYRPATGGASRLYLRINDDTPGNGNGAFGCRVQLWDPD